MNDLTKGIIVAIAVTLGGLVTMAYGTALDVTWDPQPGQAIRSSDIRGMIAQIEASVNNVTYDQMGDSAVRVGNVDSAAINTLAVADNAITARKLNYTDSSQWDTMPVRMYSGTYTGDSSTTGKQIYCNGLRPVHIEVVCLEDGGSAHASWKFDTGWDTTATFTEYGVIRSFTDTTTYGGVRATRGNNYFTVYNSVAGTKTPNLNSHNYAYVVWGY